MAAEDIFLQKSSTFVSWFESSQGIRLSQKIILADLRTRGAGRGVIAVEDIGEDEELFAIPKTLVLDYTTSDVPKSVLERIQTLDTWSILTVVIIFEYLRGHRSRWYPYFQVLPTTFDTLMFWSGIELQELQASAVRNKIGKEAAEMAWKETIIPVMLQHPEHFQVQDNGTPSKVAELIQLAHMAGSLIMAYAFDIDRDADNGPNAGGHEDDFAEDDEDDPLKGMVPFADMLNADADRNNARLFQEGDYLLMKTIKPVKAGEELFNDYGPLPRSDLLRMYGYVTDNYAPFDVVELPTNTLIAVARELSQSFPTAWGAKLKQLENEVYFDDGYAITRPHPDESLEAAIPEELNAVVKNLSADDSSFERIKGPISIKEATLLHSTLQQRLEQFPTTSQQDAEILVRLTSQPFHPTGILSKRYEMAVQIRKGEKEVCEALIDLCKDRIGRIPDLANGSKKRLQSSTAQVHDNRLQKRAKTKGQS